ncbi:Cuticle protein [Homarus americanus]|uniref:Cuticle protein n=1 Tax=Homarus americanus TaxID=6706 RepID=A0A8J5JKZ0_HOMAM|nr:Cuticle protein [Homarus americanus]
MVFTLDDGTRVEVTYTADERGFVPESPIFPTSHPLPAHVPELLAIAAEQRRQGITFDEQGKRVTG